MRLPAISTMMKSSRIRLALYLAALVATISIAPWIPGLTFLWTFQRNILRNDPGGEVGSILWARAEQLDPASAAKAGSRSGGPPSPGAWGRVLHDGFFLPVPPGELLRVQEESGALVVELAGGKYVASRIPTGSLRDLYEDELRRIGGSGSEESLDDLETLRRACSATPEDFRLSLSAAERSRYAAALLTKILLWSNAGPAEDPGAPRIRLFGPDLGRRGGAVLERSREVRIISIAPEANYVFRIPGPCPREWLEEPERWGLAGSPPEAGAPERTGQTGQTGQTDRTGN